MALKHLTWTLSEIRTFFFSLISPLHNKVVKSASRYPAQNESQVPPDPHFLSEMQCCHDLELTSSGGVRDCHPYALGRYRKIGACAGRSFYQVIEAYSEYSTAQ